MLPFGINKRDNGDLRIKTAMDEATTVAHRLELSCKPWGTFSSDDERMSCDAGPVTFARSIMIRRSVPGPCHCLSCSVHRAFPWGQDRLNGRWFEVPRQWDGDRNHVLAAIFGMAICGQAVTSKPLLAVAQISPQAVSRCSDDHVVERWKCC